MADPTIPDAAVQAYGAAIARHIYDYGVEYHDPHHATRAGLAAAYPHLAAHERERVARYIDRAVTGKRQTAAQGLLADTIVADSWAEVAGWLRENSIWTAPEHETEETTDAH